MSENEQHSTATRALHKDKVEIELVNGVEGDALYINGLRVAGPKPWGGGRTVKKWVAKRNYVLDALGLPRPPEPTK